MGTGHSPADPGHAPRGHHEPRRPGRDHRLVQAAGGRPGWFSPTASCQDICGQFREPVKIRLVPLRAADNLLLVDADPVEMVRSGYNAISGAYRSDDYPAHEYDPWLAGLLERIPGRGQVLDIGCGCGVPVARRLAAAGHQVTGVDISNIQIERARRLVPGAVFLCADATETDFPPGSFDAVVCLYALIHMPLDRQPLLLRDIVRWLRPGGWLLAVTGQDAWTGTEDNWLGGTAPMWWSQA